MNSFDIIGIGAALLDLLANVEDDFLARRNISKGHMSLTESEALKSFYRDIPLAKKASGGATANTLVAASQSGAACAFIGCVGEDKTAEQYINDLERANVRWLGTRDKQLASGECLSMITPDGERSMMTALGASSAILDEALPQAALRATKFLLLESYLWDSPKARRAAHKAADIVRKDRNGGSDRDGGSDRGSGGGGRGGGKVVLNLSDSLCVERHFDALRHFAKEKADVLLGNEEEARAFYQTQNETDFNEAIQQSHFAYAAITMGAKGAWVFEENRAAFIEAKKIEKLVDSTGAGDAFAGGFLAAISQGKSAEVGGARGADLAAKVIQHFGARE